MDFYGRICESSLEFVYLVSSTCNWSDFGLNRGASLKPDRDITSCKSQGGLESRNEESGQKLASYDFFCSRQ